MVEDYLCQLYQNMSIIGVKSEHKCVVCASRFFFRSSFVCHCDLPNFSTKFKYTLYDTSLLFRGLNVNDMPDVGS